jgi:hypothetical protein
LLGAAGITLAAILKCDFGPASSFRFGMAAATRILGLSLGPGAIAWIVWTFARIRGWRIAAFVLLWCASGFGVLVAAHAVLYLRPLVGSDAYDRATAKAAAENKRICALDPSRAALMRSLRPRLKAADRESLASIVADCDALDAYFQANIQDSRAWPDFVLRSFGEEGVSELRAEEYLRQVLPHMPNAEFEASGETLLQLIRSIKQEAEERRS